MGPFRFPTDCNNEALNRAGIRAARDVGAGVDPVHLYHPHPAAIERTLPRRVPTLGDRDVRFGVFIDALEVRDDLDCCPKRSAKRVASGRAVGFQAAPPVLVGRQV